MQFGIHCQRTIRPTLGVVIVPRNAVVFQKREDLVAVFLTTLFAGTIRDRVSGEAKGAVKLHTLLDLRGSIPTPSQSRAVPSSADGPGSGGATNRIGEKLVLLQIW